MRLVLHLSPDDSTHLGYIVCVWGGGALLIFADGDCGAEGAGALALGKFQGVCLPLVSKFEQLVAWRVIASFFGLELIT